MKFNWRKFAAVYFILTVAVMLGGCTAAWLTAVSGMLPGILAVVNAVVSFVAALEGKTVPAGLTAAFQKWESNIASEIANVQSLINDLKQSSSTTILGQIQAVMQGIATNLNSILSGLSITDSSTVSKITQLVGLAIAAANAIIALIPLAINRLNSGADEHELQAADKLATSAVNQSLTVMKETYVAIVTEHTTNAEVNAALDILPRTI